MKVQCSNWPTWKCLVGDCEIACASRILETLLDTVAKSAERDSIESEEDEKETEVVDDEEVAVATDSESDTYVCVYLDTSLV